MAATPLTLDYLHRGRPLRYLGGTSGTLGFDYFRRGRPYAGLSASAATPVTATASLNLGSIALAATAAESFSASSGVALAPLSLASSAAEAFAATGAVALGSVALGGSALESFSASAGMALSAVGIAGTVTESFSATSGIAFGPLALSATVAESFSAGAELALASLALTATATEAFTATVAVALQPVRVAATGARPAVPAFWTLSDGAHFRWVLSDTTSYAWRLATVPFPAFVPPVVTYAITDADASLQFIKVAGDHRELNDPLNPGLSLPFTIQGSTANDGPYTGYDGGTRNISAVNQGTRAFTFNFFSHISLRLPPGTIFTVENSSGNNGQYTVATADDNSHTITVLEAIPSGVADGFADLPAVVYLAGEGKSLLWVLGSSLADNTADGAIVL